MDWENIEPDKYNLLNKHYTPGRGGGTNRVRHPTPHGYGGRRRRLRKGMAAAAS